MITCKSQLMGEWGEISKQYLETTKQDIHHRIQRERFERLGAGGIYAIPLVLCFSQMTAELTVLNIILAGIIFKTLDTVGTRFFSNTEESFEARFVNRFSEQERTVEAVIKNLENIGQDVTRSFNFK